MYVIYAILPRNILHESNFCVFSSKYAANNIVEFFDNAHEMCSTRQCV